MSAHDLAEAVEAARRIQRERYIGSQFVTDARTVARALLSLSSADAGEMRERCAKAVEGMRACPFDKHAPSHDLRPEDPCPVCGDLGTIFALDKPSNCQSPSAIIRSLPLTKED